MEAPNSIRVSLLYPETKVVSGYGRYANRLISGLKSLKEVNLELLPVRKTEITFGGRPLLGTASQMISAKLKVPHSDIVHSLSPTVVNKKTNVVTLHDLIPLTMKKEFADTYYRKRGYEIIFNAVKGVENIIVFNSHWKKIVMEQFNIRENRVHVVGQSIDHSQFYSQIDVNLIPKDGRKLIITVGDMNPRKRYDILFEALGNRNDIEVVHIGPVNAWVKREHELRKIASKYNNIHFLGEIDFELLRKYMSTADLLVHLTEDEGFGSTPVEAMACGTTSVVSNIPVLKDVLEDRAFFTALDPDSVANTVDQALKNKKDPTDLVNFSRNYSIEQMARNTVSVYKKVLSSVQ